MIKIHSDHFYFALSSWFPDYIQRCCLLSYCKCRLKDWYLRYQNIYHYHSPFWCKKLYCSDLQNIGSRGLQSDSYNSQILMSCLVSKRIYLSFSWDQFLRRDRLEFFLHYFLYQNSLQINQALEWHQNDSSHMLREEEYH